MGTDIHMYVEKRINGKWTHARGMAIPRWSDPGDPARPTPLDIARCYDLFAILADVRNGRGAAGCATGEGFQIIAEPRGFPDDASPEMKKEWKELGEHTPSYLTLAELLAFDWDRVATHYGIVSSDEYLIFKEKGKPESWCGGTSAKIITPEEMETLFAAAAITGRPVDPRIYTQVAWQETYRESVYDWLTVHVPYLETIGKPEDVRIVFWFDS